jgi:hypothetical protein
MVTRVRALLAIEWMMATTVALVLAHLAFEIVGAALMGVALLFLLPIIGGVVGGLLSAGNQPAGSLISGMAVAVTLKAEPHPH